MKQIGRYGLWVPEDTDAPDGPTDLTKLAESVEDALDKSGAQGGMSYVSGVQTRENAAFGVMGTPDEVTKLVLDKDGFIDVFVYGQMRQSVTEAGRIAIFLNSTQTKSMAGESAMSTGGAETNKIASITEGWKAFWSDGTGLHLLLGGGPAPELGHIVGANLNPPTESSVRWGGCSNRIFAPAGEYAVSLRYKASSGKIEARNRFLIAQVVTNGLY